MASGVRQGNRFTGSISFGLNDFKPSFLTVQNYQGSIIGYTDAAGALNTSNIYAYGPYGEPFTKNAATGALTPSWSGARFRYTGQTLLGDAKLYY